MMISKQLPMEIEQEDDCRWIAEVVELPGVLAYGETRDLAINRAIALGLRVIADRVENAEDIAAVCDSLGEKTPASGPRTA